jgi:epoxyqueuosine reductase
MTTLSTLWPALSRVARDEGVLRVGATDIDDAHVTLFNEWLDRGHQATMGYLEKSRAIRNDPHARFPWARSAVVILVPYASERPAAGRDALSSHLARYALGDDYHQVLDRILRAMEVEIHRGAPDVRTWRYVDTGPLSDRSLAAQSGLGWIGRNGMLIDEEHGSYFFIGSLLTSLPNDITATEVADRCGACTRCVEACPTGAILPNRTVASERCISYGTIEHRGPLDERLSHALGGNAFGCDICQEVCPWNSAPAEAHPAFAPRDEYRSTPVTDLLRFTQADFSSLFRRSAVKRAKLAGMQRNVGALISAARSETRG